jgi:hypothetical protein
VTREEAVELYRTKIQEWISRPRDAEKVLTLLKGPAGAGKTRVVIEEELRAQVGTGPGETFAELTGGKIPDKDPGKMLVALPRHALAREVKTLSDEKDAAIEFWKVIGYKKYPVERFGIPILEGRDKDNCKRYDLVSKAQKNGYSAEALCKRKLPGGEVVCCPHFNECPYQERAVKVQEADNAIYMHAHLTVGWIGALALKSRKRLWIDEDPTSTFLDDAEIAEEELRFIAEGRETREPGFVPLATLGADLVTGLSAPEGLLSHLATLGWNEERIGEAAKRRAEIEADRRAESRMRADLSDEELDKALVRVKRVGRLAVVLERLAAEMSARGQGESYSLRRLEGKIVAQGRKPTNELPPNILLTDATANPLVILPKLWLGEKGAESYLRSRLAKAWFELHRCDVRNPRSSNISLISPTGVSKAPRWEFVEYRQAATGRGGARRWSRALVDAAVDERRRPSVLAVVLGADLMTLEMRPFCEDPPKRQPL